MSFCLGKASATVSFFSGGQKDQVTVSPTPIDITCENPSQCGVAGSWTLSYRAEIGITSSYTFDGFANESYYLKSVPSSGCRNGERWDLWGNCAGVERLILETFSCFAGRITFTNQQFSPGSSATTLKIFHNGTLLFSKVVDRCDFEVSCEDGCPEGQCKCPKDGYPGYCCLPCAELASQIRSIHQRL
ncbi:hypothetical protein BST81_03555 [Leptolyngbya sp. 'hensonii']|nr:hypothetical protein BST81_03555 [Leptolyngbya sp. 'hensonii']